MDVKALEASCNKTKMMIIESFADPKTFRGYIANLSQALMILVQVFPTCGPRKNF